MNDKNIVNEEQLTLKIINNLAEQIKFMTFLLFEIKAGTPVGKILVFLLKYHPSTIASCHERVVPKTFPVSFIIESAEVTEEELWQSLDYLQQNGIIQYNERTENC